MPTPSSSCRVQPCTTERVRHGIAAVPSGGARERSCSPTTAWRAAGRAARQAQPPVDRTRAETCCSTPASQPTALVVLTRRVHSTYDEARRVRRLTRDATGISSLLIVTSPYHSRRALWVLRRVLEPRWRARRHRPAATRRAKPAPGVWWLSSSGWHSVARRIPEVPVLPASSIG